MDGDIYTWAKSQETQYGLAIEVMENWSWCMKEHIRYSILLKHGKFIKSTNELETKNPNRNIVYPMLNTRYKAEDIDLKDVLIYVNDSEQYHLSFMVKKYHDEVYIDEHDLDTLFDELLEEKIDLGGTIVRKGRQGPVHEPLDSIAFCDQTDLNGGPIGFKTHFNPEELYAMADSGWGDSSKGATVTLDELVTLADEAKQQDANNGLKTQTPGKYIEVYRIHGVMPARWLKDNDQSKLKDNEKYVRQLHVIAFYKSKEGLDTGVTLYRAREYENPFKIHLSGTKLRNRALAYGGVEELFDPQIWTNYSEIRKKELLDALSKVIRWTNDENLASRNKISDLDNNEILTVRDGAQVGVLETPTVNVQLFNEWLLEWERTAQNTSGATDALLGKNPSAGTPFKLENLVTTQGQGLHDRRRGKFATFVAEMYRDWIIPDIAKEIANGTKFLATLSQDELEYVADCMVRSKTHDYVKERILSGQTVDDAQVEEFKQKVRDDFMRGGNKRFIEILKDEFKNVTIHVKVNVAGKQKDLEGTVDKLTNVLRFVFSTYDPQTKTFAALEDPKAMKVFNKLIEYSGLDPIDFGYAVAKPQPTQTLQPGATPAQSQPVLPANQPVA